MNPFIFFWKVNVRKNWVIIEVGGPDWFDLRNFEIAWLKIKRLEPWLHFYELLAGEIGHLAALVIEEVERLTD